MARQNLILGLQAVSAIGILVLGLLTYFGQSGRDLRLEMRQGFESIRVEFRGEIAALRKENRRRSEGNAAGIRVDPGRIQGRNRCLQAGSEGRTRRHSEGVEKYQHPPGPRRRTPWDPDSAKTGSLIIDSTGRISGSAERTGSAAPLNEPGQRVRTNRVNGSARTSATGRRPALRRRRDRRGSPSRCRGGSPRTRRAGRSAFPRPSG